MIGKLLVLLIVAADIEWWMLSQWDERSPPPNTPRRNTRLAILINHTHIKIFGLDIKFRPNHYSGVLETEDETT